MSNPQISGQDLIDGLKINLGGLSNAFSVDQLLYFLNLGTQEVWAVIKSLDLDYFGDSSESTDPTQDEYVSTFVTNQREYNLPTNCREPRFIECTTAGFEDRIFEYRKFDDPLFAVARRQATANGPSGGATSGSIIGNYYYTIFGTQLILAQYPEATLTFKLWYISAIDDVTVNSFPNVLHPFVKKIVDYATKRAVLSTQNGELEAAWKDEWLNTIKTLALSAGPRTSTNSIFVQDYTGQ